MGIISPLIDKDSIFYTNAMDIAICSTQHNAKTYQFNIRMMKNDCKNILKVLWALFYES